MKLISIGSSSEAQVVLKSQFVSAYHAELLQLDNGDMLLVDKGSSNGTFVNGVKLIPEKEVSVTPQDDIRLADQPMPWGMIPMHSIADKDEIASIKSVGTHRLNTYCIQSPQVSRFHATIKQKKNGKWYICDHSTNGTTVNDVRLPKDKYVELKAGDSIRCADVVISNPIPKKSSGNKSSILKYVAIAACVCVLIGGGLFAWTKLGGWPKNIYSKYAPATTVLEVGYYFRIQTEQHGIERFVIVEDDYGVPHLQKYNGRNAMTGAATGFFISSNGVLVTNQHVAQPWLYGEDKDMLATVAMAFHKETNIALSDIKTDGVIEYIYAVPHGQYFDSTNATKCHVIAASGTHDEDVAILQTVSTKLPDSATFIPVSKISGDNVAIGTEVFTMGFPLIGTLQDTGDKEATVKKALQATGAAGVVTQNNDKFRYGFDAASNNGASGSPIFDKNGKLIGIVTSGVTSTQGYNFGLKSKYIIKILDSIKE
ncbi:MAG: FHA domain-containing protein [Alistipes sp.]|nr:FHA domain-containing protein [Alistipes sp.]